MKSTFPVIIKALQVWLVKLQTMYETIKNWDVIRSANLTCISVVIVTIKDLLSLVMLVQCTTNLFTGHHQHRKKYIMSFPRVTSAHLDIQQIIPYTHKKKSAHIESDRTWRRLFHFCSQASLTLKLACCVLVVVVLLYCTVPQWAWISDQQWAHGKYLN